MKNRTFVMVNSPRTVRAVIVSLADKLGGDWNFGGVVPQVLGSTMVRYQFPQGTIVFRCQEGDNPSFGSVSLGQAAGEPGVKRDTGMYDPKIALCDFTVGDWSLFVWGGPLKVVRESRPVGEDWATLGQFVRFADAYRFARRLVRVKMRGVTPLATLERNPATLPPLVQNEAGLWEEREFPNLPTWHTRMSQEVG